jgi:hypothetical protein
MAIMNADAHILDSTCIGYLGHPFVKEASWAFTARLFLLVR